MDESLIGKKVSFRLAYNEWYEGNVIGEYKRDITVKITSGWSPNESLADKVASKVGSTVTINHVEKILQ